jgi:3-deoxy-7-phosphoheptulonate synthase
VVGHGNPDVFLCERGIQTFADATRYTLDLSSVPVARERTHLPVVVDPSHAAGTRRWVPPLVRAALGAGADGVMVEAHPNPDAALSDGPQSLSLDTLPSVARAVRRAAA